jgi:hypothetical protein
MTMQTLDFKKDLKHLYNPSTKKPEILDIPPMKFLMIDGAGDPNTTQAFRDAVSTLYTVAYTLRFMVKKEQDIAYTVMPLEGLWWMDDMTQFSMERKDDWLWTAMIMQPDFINETMFRQAIDEARRKKNPPALAAIRLETFREGKAVQIMHIGPYSAEAPTIQALHRFAAESGYELAGKHHEIYLSDPGRTALEKLKTVIRQPVKAR